MCTTFSHKYKNITQNGQNQSCDTIALKRRYLTCRAAHRSADAADGGGGAEHGRDGAAGGVGEASREQEENEARHKQQRGHDDVPCKANRS